MPLRARSSVRPALPVRSRLVFFLLHLSSQLISADAVSRVAIPGKKLVLSPEYL